jgi:hypothetical protein
MASSQGGQRELDAEKHAKSLLEITEDGTDVNLFAPGNKDNTGICETWTLLTATPKGDCLFICPETKAPGSSGGGSGGFGRPYKSSAQVTGKAH